MAKKISKRKRNSIVIGVTLTLVFVLLGGCIAALVTGTNPKDWFVKTEYTAPEYSELGEDMVKEYDAFYLNTSKEGLKNLETLFDTMTQEFNVKTLSYIGDTSVGYEHFNDYILMARRESIETEEGVYVDLKCILLCDRITNSGVALWCNQTITIDGFEFVEGFQNLGENGLLVWDGEPISGAIAEGDIDFDSFELISINPVK